jgi:murein DD-endopeptidase MepM/ murein hydrolase activator NlpD
MELVTAFLWFNPLIYYYKKSIKEIHEYLADQKAISSGQDKTGYLDVLMKQTMQRQNIALVSSYKQSLTRKRMTMMMRTKSGKSAGLKVCAVLPIIAFLTFNFALVITPQSTEAYDDAVLYADEEFPEYENELVFIPPISGGDITVIAASESMKKEEQNGKVEYRMSVDIHAPAKSPVLAAGEGTVFKVQTNKAGKNFIVLDHRGGYKTSYSGLGSLIDMFKTTGTRVTQGEVIGYLNIQTSSGKPVLRYELILPHEIIDSTKHIQQHIQQIIE